VSAQLLRRRERRLEEECHITTPRGTGPPPAAAMRPAAFCALALRRRARGRAPTCSRGALSLPDAGRPSRGAAAALSFVQLEEFVQRPPYGLL
jgi:hypothetical protein